MWHSRFCCALALAHFWVWHSYSTVLYFMTVKQYFTKKQWFYNFTIIYIFKSLNHISRPLLVFLNWHSFFPLLSSLGGVWSGSTLFSESVFWTSYSSKTMFICKNVKITNEPTMPYEHSIKTQISLHNCTVCGFRIRRMQFIIFA